MDKLADNINASFQGVSADMTALTPHESFTVGNSYHVPDIYIISVSKVEKQLMNTKTNKAIGPDNIPNWILRDLAPLIAGPICAIYNSSFREGFLPQIWKSADVIPLPKIEPPKLVDKHLRPISLTPVLSKGAEEHARGWIMEFMEEVLDQHQFGSRKGHSTVHALVELHHQWLEAVETTGRVVRVLMLDFRKAFDRVDHHILLTKLSNLGLPDFLVRWMTAFLCERQQRVKIGQTTSSWRTINAGVPQGTLLGPPCFLLHINDLQTCCNMCKYVDDSSMWEECDRSGHDSKIQQAAEEAVKWSNDNNMQLNFDKTQEMMVYFGRKPHNITPVTMEGRAIQRVSVSKLLGVMLSDDLGWDAHVDYICGKASKRIYFLRLLKRGGATPKEVTDTYIAIIRSVLEYACEVWHTGLGKLQSDDIENLQIRAMKIAHPELSYDKALEKEGLDTLAHRREEICRQFFNAMQSEQHKLHYLLPPPRETRYLRNPIKYELPKLHTKRFKNGSLVNYGLFNFQ